MIKKFYIHKLVKFRLDVYVESLLLRGKMNSQISSSYSLYKVYIEGPTQDFSYEEAFQNDMLMWVFSFIITHILLYLLNIVNLV